MGSNHYYYYKLDVPFIVLPFPNFFFTQFLYLCRHFETPLSTGTKSLINPGKGTKSKFQVPQHTRNNNTVILVPIPPYKTQNWQRTFDMEDLYPSRIIYIERETETDRQKQTGRQTDRQTDRQTETDRQRETDR